jgi:hypothetical protein
MCLRNPWGRSVGGPRACGMKLRNEAGCALPTNCMLLSSPIASLCCRVWSKKV